MRKVEGCKAATLFAMEKEAEELLRRLDYYGKFCHYGGARKIPVLCDTSDKEDTPDKEYVGSGAIERRIKEIKERSD